MPYVALYWVVWAMQPFVKISPDELFDKYVLDGNIQKPSDFRIIEGLERTQFFTPLRGPVYIYIKTEDNFVTSLVERDSRYWSPYTEISCASFFKVVDNLGDSQSYPDEFEWWLPTSVASPVCYQSEHKSPFYADESKYLLVDNHSDEVYFLQTITPQAEVY